MALRGLRMYLIGGQTREANRSTYEVAVSLGALVDGVDVDDADVLIGDSVNTPEYLTNTAEPGCQTKFRKVVAHTQLTCTGLAPISSPRLQQALNIMAPAADALQRQAQPFPAPSASSAVEAVKAVRSSSLDPGGKAKPGSTTERPTALAPSTTAGRAHLPNATTTSATTVAQLPPLPAAQPRPAAPPPAHGPGASRQPQLQEAPSRPVHDEAGTSCLFMDWVRFHAVGMSAQETLELRRLVCEGGAVREPALVGRVTHILVGSEPTAAELQAVRDHMAEWRDAVKVVRGLGWLHTCCVAGRYVEPQACNLLTPAALMTACRTTSMLSAVTSNGAAAAAMADGELANGHTAPIPGKPSSSHPAPAASRGAGTSMVEFGDEPSALLPAQDSRSRPGQLPGTVAPSAAQEPAVDAAPTLPADARSALQGLWFTLAALAGLPEDEQAVTNIIKSHGGMIFTSSSARLVKDPGRAYAVCPHSLVEMQLRELERKADDFKLVPPAQRVTLYWLQECLASRQLLPPHVFGQPAYRPWPFQLPVRGFDSLRLHVSGVHPSMRAGIFKVISLLGGEIHTDMSASTTHLVLKEATLTTKYSYAVKWGIQIVNELWVLHCAYKGCLVDPWDPLLRPQNETSEMRREQQRQQQAVAAQKLQRKLSQAVPAEGEAGGMAMGATQFPHPAGGQQHRGGWGRAAAEEGQAPGGTQGATHRLITSRASAFANANGSKSAAPMPPPPQQQQQQPVAPSTGSQSSCAPASSGAMPLPPASMGKTHAGGNDSSRHQAKPRPTSPDENQQTDATGLSAVPASAAAGGVGVLQGARRPAAAAAPGSTAAAPRLSSFLEEVLRPLPDTDNTAGSATVTKAGKGKPQSSPGMDVRGFDSIPQGVSQPAATARVHPVIGTRPTAAQQQQQQLPSAMPIAGSLSRGQYGSRGTEPAEPGHQAGHHASSHASAPASAGQPRPVPPLNPHTDEQAAGHVQGRGAGAGCSTHSPEAAQVEGGSEEAEGSGGSAGSGGGGAAGAAQLEEAEGDDLYSCQGDQEGAAVAGGSGGEDELDSIQALIQAASSSRSLAGAAARAPGGLMHGALHPGHHADHGLEPGVGQESQADALYLTTVAVAAARGLGSRAAGASTGSVGMGGRDSRGAPSSLTSMSHDSSGGGTAPSRSARGQEGDATSHPMGPPAAGLAAARRKGMKRGAQGQGVVGSDSGLAGVRKGGRAGAHGNQGPPSGGQFQQQNEDGMPVEMSQQVGYDVGQRPAERLTRARSRPLATGQVAADTAPGGQAEGLKQALINRVQSGRSGAPVGRSDASSLDAVMDML
ncbi:hypothetical protein QJQ45_026225 [Haematococcus lacustris]|nr:hypothetical protein QJQ45_026225 [Haematococcus lacustris]